MGQFFAEVYRRFPDAELTAIAEWNDERRPVVGKRFGVKALHKDVNSMLKEVVPDIAAERLAPVCPRRHVWRCSILD